MLSQSWDQKEPPPLPGVNSFQAAAPKAEPQSPELCWPWGQRDRAGPTLHQKSQRSVLIQGSTPRRGSLATWKCPFSHCKPSGLCRALWDVPEGNGLP